jgi:hypothetical protein
MVWNGTRAGVAWIEDSTPLQAYFRTVPLDGAALPISSLGVLAQGETVDVAWDGANWRLAWSDDDPNREVMLSTDGAAPRALTANTRQDMRARIAPLSGGKIAYLWAVDSPAFGLHLTIFDATGTKLVDDVSVATETGTLETHNLIWTGSELVVFYATGAKLMMLRLDETGKPLAAPIMITSQPSSFNFASASWTGDRFLIAWITSADGMRVAYFDKAGAMLAPSLPAPANDILSSIPSVAVGPTSDAVAWDTVWGQAYVVEVLRNGTYGKLYTFEAAYEPSVAWVGSTWAVALVQRQTPPPSNPNPIPDNINVVQLCR